MKCLACLESTKMVSSGDNWRWVPSDPPNLCSFPLDPERTRSTSGVPGRGWLFTRDRGHFPVCGRTSKVCDEVGPWIVNNTDPSSVILTQQETEGSLSSQEDFLRSSDLILSAWDLPGVNVVWLLPTALGMFQLLS